MDFSLIIPPSLIYISLNSFNALTPIWHILVGKIFTIFAHSVINLEMRCKKYFEGFKYVYQLCYKSAGRYQFFSSSFWKFVLCTNMFEHFWNNMSVFLYSLSVSPHHFLNKVMVTHWGRDKMASISQTTLLNAFSWMKMYEFRLKFRWSLFLSVQSTLFHHRFR